jgi:hypothetical protein
MGSRWVKGYGQLCEHKVGPRAWVLIKFWETPYGQVPAGFVSDGASSHRIMWAIVDPATEFFEASVIHDFLYRFGIGTRKAADEAWRDTAQAYGASRFRTQLGYRALRMFGHGFGSNAA